MKPFLLRMSKAHYLINLRLYQTVPLTIDVESHPIQTHQTYRWAETHMVSDHYQVSFVFCWGWPSMHVSMVYDQTIDGRRNREQIWGRYFAIEMIKLSYLGLLIVGLLQWGTDMYVSQNIKELLYRPSRIHS